MPRHLSRDAPAISDRLALNVFQTFTFDRRQPPAEQDYRLDSTVRGTLLFDYSVPFRSKLPSNYVLNLEIPIQSEKKNSPSYPFLRDRFLHFTTLRRLDSNRRYSPFSIRFSRWVPFRFLLPACDLSRLAASSASPPARTLVGWPPSSRSSTTSGYVDGPLSIRHSTDAKHNDDDGGDRCCCSIIEYYGEFPCADWTLLSTTDPRRGPLQVECRPAPLCRSRERVFDSSLGVEARSWLRKRCRQVCLGVERYRVEVVPVFPGQVR